MWVSVNVCIGYPCVLCWYVYVLILNKYAIELVRLYIMSK